MGTWIPFQVSDLTVLHQDRIERHLDQVPYPDAVWRCFTLGGAEAGIVRHFNLRNAPLSDVADADTRVLVLEWDARHSEGSAESLIEDTIWAILLSVDVENVR